uniref:Uncharacterized protein n=1 Tax=Schistocephalus solidus TaxID=70667 RepID=A0A0X3PHU6_SCHSO
MGEGAGDNSKDMHRRGAEFMQRWRRRRRSSPSRGSAILTRCFPSPDAGTRWSTSPHRARLQVLRAGSASLGYHLLRSLHGPQPDSNVTVGAEQSGKEQCTCGRQVQQQ